MPLLSILARTNLLPPRQATKSTQIDGDRWNKRWLHKISASEVPRCSRHLFSFFFSSVVTLSDSPCRMPCQDKSTIQPKSSLLSVDMKHVLSPGGPMFNRASSDVFPFVFRLYFLQLVMAHWQPPRPRPHQNGCAVNYNSVTWPGTWPQRKWSACTPRDRRGVFKLVARDPEAEKGNRERSPRILQLTGRKYFFRAFIIWIYVVFISLPRIQCTFQIGHW